MASRGPDGVGEWISPTGEVALGHRRLAIIDLSETGAQPMSRAQERYWIVHNGEIYNYRELRSELEVDGISFRSSSDTEVLLALYERDGVEMLSRLRGMYAFAIWDSRHRRLFMARDPYGIKPLYYACDGATLRFASQVKSLEASGAVSSEIDHAGLVGFLIWGSVPEPLTLRKSIRALPAGHFLVASGGGVGEPQEYFDLSEATRRPEEDEQDPASALEESVRYHLVADVPVGSFLSAGLDSAVVTALAARQLDHPMTTLTLRFPTYLGTPRDEGPVAARVALALGTHHIEHTVSRAEFLDLWPQALEAMDQPSIDGFNTYVVSKIAKLYGLKVVLSGLGGDELLGSYSSFRDLPRWVRWTKLASRLPAARAILGLISRAAPSRPKLRGLLKYGKTPAGAYLLRRGLFLPEELPGILGDDLAAEGLASYDPLVDVGSCFGEVLAGCHNGVPDWTTVHLLESTQYMRNQLLRDSDWASMAHSIELRVPFVDTRLRSHLAAAAFEPARSQGKSAFLRSLATELPPVIWERPKSGFSIPVLDLLNGNASAAVGSSAGMDSRALGLRVLEEFGVELASI